MAETSDPIETALKQLLQERADLDTVIAALQKRLGHSVTAATSLPIGARSGQPVGEIVVYRGEFYNLSITKAAEKLLKRIGRPLKTPEILDAFTRAGYEIKAKRPRSNIYTALVRSRIFVKVLPDTWGLAESHPEAAALKKDTVRTKKQRKQKTSKRSLATVEKAQPEAVLKPVA